MPNVVDAGNVAGTLPWIGTRFVDANGNITEPWLQLLYLLFRRTGSQEGSSPEEFYLNNFGIETTFSPADPSQQNMGDVISSPAAGQNSGDSAAGGDISATGGISQKDFADVFAPIIQNIVRDILANEITAPAAAHNPAVSALIDTSANPSTSATLPEMVFAPLGTTNYTGAPVAITLTGSPMSIRAGRLISLSLDGTVTDITFQRGTFSRGLPNSTPFVLLDPGDILIITYTGSPSIYAIPR